MKNHNTPQTPKTSGWYDITVGTFKKYKAYLESEKHKDHKTPQGIAKSTSRLLSVMEGLPSEVINDLTIDQRETLLSTYAFLQTLHEPDTSRFGEQIYRIMLGDCEFCVNPQDIRGAEWEAFESCFIMNDPCMAIAYLLRNEAAYDGLKYDFEAEDKAHTEQMVDEHMSVGDALDLAFFLQNYFLESTANTLKSLRHRILKEQMLHPIRTHRLANSAKAGSSSTPKSSKRSERRSTR